MSFNSHFIYTYTLCTYIFRNMQFHLLRTIIILTPLNIEIETRQGAPSIKDSFFSILLWHDFEPLFHFSSHFLYFLWNKFKTYIDLYAFCAYESPSITIKILKTNYVCNIHFKQSILHVLIQYLSRSLIPFFLQNIYEPNHGIYFRTNLFVYISVFNWTRIIWKTFFFLFFMKNNFIFLSNLLFIYL